jgi:hypothetical protein
MQYTFDVAAFRAAYPAFADPTAYPTTTLQAYWDTATLYIDSNDYPCAMLQGQARNKALNLMTAHLTFLSNVIAKGNYSQVPGLIQSATIDKITVSLTPPPQVNQWQWWLNQTPYGQQLLALLQVNSVGGIYVGGLPEGRGFRKVYGIF